QQRLPRRHAVAGDQPAVDGAGWGEAGKDRVAPGDLLEQQRRPARGPGREVHEERRPDLRRGAGRVPHVGGSGKADAVHHRDHRAGSAALVVSGRGRRGEGGRGGWERRWRGQGGEATTVGGEEVGRGDGGGGRGE